MAVINKTFLPITDKANYYKVLDNAVHILKTTGMLVESDVLLEYLRKYGAVVDVANKTAKFPEAVIYKTIDLLKSDAGRHKSQNICDADRIKLHYGTEAFFVYDRIKRLRYAPYPDEIAELIRLGDTLCDVGSVSMPVLDSRADPETEALEAVELLYANTSKYSSAGVRSHRQIKYFIEIDRLFGHDIKDLFFTQTGRCMVSPLRFGLENCLIYEELIKAGATDKLWVANMPIMGATSPVTTAGTAALAVAELLAGWSVGKAVNEACASGATIICGSMDMKHARGCFGTPEAIKANILVYQTILEITGKSLNLDVGYSDAKLPGMQIAHERTLIEMAMLHTTGARFTVGMLDAAKTFSPCLAMIDIDIAKCILSYCREIDFSDESFATGVIGAVGYGGRNSYIETEHTLDHYRDALWSPTLFDRSFWEDGREEEKEASLFDRVDEMRKASMKKYVPPVCDPRLLDALRGVVKKARKDLRGV